MDFSEFIRRIGAEPRSRDPELLAARDSSPEHREAVIKAEAFEEKLERAVDLPVPGELVEELVASATQGRANRRTWWPEAFAASVLVAVGAAGMGWKMANSWESVEDYVMDHYRHDGEKVLELAQDSPYGDVEAVLAKFDLEATPELANIVSVIKYCPTPEGRGVHMILNTETGPVTVFYMPDTHVTDREMLAFDAMEAMLVDLENGSAAIIGSGTQHIQDLYAVVHDSIIPSPERS
jgi:hypothetical protein